MGAIGENKLKTKFESSCINVISINWKRLKLKFEPCCRPKLKFKLCYINVVVIDGKRLKLKFEP